MSDPDGPWHDRGAHLRDEPTRRTLPEVVGELVWRYLILNRKPHTNWGSQSVLPDADVAKA